MKNTLTIESMAYLGAGVARTDEGKALFVDGAIAGDLIRPLTVQNLPKHDRCMEFELIEPSPARVKAPCAYADACGGCPWQAMDYQEQLRWKRQSVVDALERIGRIPGSEALTSECVPSQEQWHYRNKIELEAFVKSGKLNLGMHKKQSDECVTIDECLLLPKPLMKLPSHLAGALNYSIKNERDMLTRVAIRSSTKTGSSELALFMLPSGINRPLVTKALESNADFSSLVRVIISGEVAERKVKKVEVLAGPGYWHEKLAGNQYKISASSFFQTNSGVAAAMVAHLTETINELNLDNNAAVADLYSGAGTFTLPLARCFDKVTAIESYGSSIRDLRRNLDEAGLAAQVIGGDVARELSSLNPVELAIIDPPRSGLKPEATKALLEWGPRHLIYLSCNPTTMARDIGMLAQDYQLVRATPFDQFPQSYHVEAMALLKRCW